MGSPRERQVDLGTKRMYLPERPTVVTRHQEEQKTINSYKQTKPGQCWRTWREQDGKKIQKSGKNSAVSPQMK